MGKPSSRREAHVDTLWRRGVLLFFFTHTHTLFKGLHTHLRQVIAPGTSSAPSWKKTQKRKNGTSTAEKNSLESTIRKGNREEGSGLRLVAGVHGRWERLRGR